MESFIPENIKVLAISWLGMGEKRFWWHPLKKKCRLQYLVPISVR